MKLLIIGSKGFIGSHCHRHFSKTNDVWHCDLTHAQEDPKYFVIEPMSPDFSEPFKSQKFDVCINCSGAASVGDSFKQQARDFKHNVINVHSILEAIRLHNPECRYINLSSAAVYGDPTRLPIKETHSRGAISPYGTHKQQSEDLCEQFFNQHGTRTCSLRIFSAYGPGLRKQLFWDLFLKTRNSESITLFGTGEETRDFIYIDDLTYQIELAITHSNWKADIINCANGQQTRIADAVDIFTRLADWRGEVIYTGFNRKGDPRHWEADISRMNGFGFRNKTSLERGLAAYADWLKIQEPMMKDCV